MEEQAQKVEELEAQLQQLQASHLGHISQEANFQRTTMHAAAKTGNWWAFVRLSRAHRYQEATQVIMED
jgi:hypothetical protein